MRLLLDQGLPRGAVTFLRASGLQAQHVGELGMSTASDRALLEYARKAGMVVVTLDADFHQLLAQTESSFPSVVRLRIEGLKEQPLAELLVRVLKSVGDALTQGAAVSVTPDRIRVRHLPLRDTKE